MNAPVDIRLTPVTATSAGRVERVRLRNALADLHVSAFPHSFLTSLGRAFLGLLYAGFVTQPKGLCVIAETPGGIVGFAAGTLEPSGFFRGLLRRQALAFAVAAVPGLLKHPLFAARKCLGALCYRGETPGGIPDAALLSSLAVSPATQSQGVGQALVRAFTAEVRRCGGKAVYLTTDEHANERVNRFYARCGFELQDTFTRPGNRVMNRWVMRLI